MMGKQSKKKTKKKTHVNDLKVQFPIRSRTALL